MFARFREAARRRAALRNPVDPGGWAALMSAKPIFSRLGPVESGRLAYLSAAFLAEKDFVTAFPGEGGRVSLHGGDGVDYAVRLEIAAHACLCALGPGLDALRSFRTVIVTPEAYSSPQEDLLPGGVVAEWEDDVAGESFPFGPISVSARDLADSGMGDGYDVVIHEVAHKLDEADGELNGVPLLPRTISPAEWKGAFSSAFSDMRRRARRERYAGRRRGLSPCPIDPYAAEDPAEFFAVACEYFFDAPEVLRGAYPEVWELLSRFFSSLA